MGKVAGRVWAGGGFALAFGLVGAVAWTQHRADARLVSLRSNTISEVSRQGSRIDTTAVQVAELKRDAEALRADLDSFRTALAAVRSAEEEAYAYGPSDVRLACLDPKKTAKSIEGAKALFLTCEPELKKVLGPVGVGMEEPDRFAIFAAIFADHVFDYGHSLANGLDEILSERRIACDRAALLVVRLVKHFYPDADIGMIGLDGGYLGNHALATYSRGDIRLLLDGTSALVARADIDDVLKGHPLSVYSMIDFHADVDEDLELLRRRVRGALRVGAIRPEHVIYRHRNLSEINAVYRLD